MTFSKKIIGLIAAGILALGVGIGFAADVAGSDNANVQRPYYCYGPQSGSNTGSSYGCPGWRR